MHKTIKRIAQAVGVEPLTAGPQTLALLRAECLERNKTPKGKKPVKLTQEQEAVIINSHWDFHVDRAAQAWLAVASALLLDSGQLTDDLLVGGIAKKQVLFFTLLDIHHLLLKWVKENTVLLSAQLLEQESQALNLSSCDNLREKVSQLLEIGDVPKSGVLGFGWVRDRCITLRQMALRKKKVQSFRLRLYAEGQNVLYIKRGMPSALQADIEAGLLEHRAALSTTREPVGGVQGDEDRRRMIDALDDLAYSIFQGREFVPVEQCPSTNAGFGAPRSRGGAFQHLACLGALVTYQAYADNVLTLPMMCAMHEVRPGRPVALYMPSGQVYILSQVGKIISLGAIYECTKEGGLRLIDAEPAGIVEPCKLRVITKGRPLAYHRGLCLQKFLHGTLRTVSVFQYIGCPIRKDNWDMPTELLPGEFYVSGDYKGATDNLDPTLCNAAWRAICNTVQCDGVPLALHPLWAPLGQQLLTGHRLHYQRVVRNKVAADPAVQSWGQLMGSPVSFPILNLVNAAATAVGTGWRPDQYPLVGSDGGLPDRYDDDHRSPYVSVLAHLEKIHCRTNGDDVAFVSNPRTYQRWTRVVTNAGLAPSLGKNYTSRHFCIMNSEMRCPVRAAGPPELVTRVYESDDLVNPEYDATEIVHALLPPPRVWEEVRFLNLPILFGIESKGNDAGQSVVDRLCWWELRGLSLALCAGCESEVADRRLAAFESYYESVLDRIPIGVNRYVHPCLGGAGIVPRSYHTWDRLPEKTRLRAGWLACLDPMTRIEAVTPPTDVWTWGNFRSFESSGPVCTIKTLVEPELSELEQVENQWMVEAGILPHTDRPTGAFPLDCFSQHCAAAFTHPYDYDVNRDLPTAPCGHRVDPGEMLCKTRELRETKYARRIRDQCNLANGAGKFGRIQPITDEKLWSWSETKVLSVREVYPTLRIRVDTWTPSHPLGGLESTLDPSQVEIAESDYIEQSMKPNSQFRVGSVQRVFELQGFLDQDPRFSKIEEAGRGVELDQLFEAPCPLRGDERRSHASRCAPWCEVDLKQKLRREAAVSRPVASLLGSREPRTSAGSPAEDQFGC